MDAQGSASSNCQVSTLLSVQEKGSGNKRKFRADQLLGEPNNVNPSMQNECLTYEFSAEKFESTTGHGQPSGCDLCGVGQDHSDGLKLDLGLDNAVVSSEIGPSTPREELELEEFYDANWSDHVESQLEELVLSNLDSIFTSAIKKIIACGYTEEAATKAILRSGLCYGRKDMASNIVDNTLAFLKSGQEICPSRQHCFEDLQQLEKYTLAELVCVLREFKPFFSIGDAMWCLLICDMDVSYACAMDGDSLSSFVGDGASDGTSMMFSQTQLKTDALNSEVSLPNRCNSTPPSSMAVVPHITKPKNSAVLSAPASDIEGPNSTSDTVGKSFGVTVTSKSSVLEEKFGSNRKAHSGSSKREYMLRQKSLHLEKSFRTYGSKGSSRAGKLSGLGGLILDKKLKSVSESTAVHIKNASLKISKAMGVDVPQNSQKTQNLPNNPGSFSPQATLPQTILPTTLHPVNTTVLPMVSSPPLLSTVEAELSKSNPAPIPVNFNTGIPNSIYAGMPYEKSIGQWLPRNKKDEMILKLIPRVQELQNQLQEWTEWANQKVMQAARRLSKDKAELKTLRQEKEEVERLKKEKQSLEENTMKKLAEMENALCKATGQVEKANTAFRRLEVENAAIRRQMDAAKLSVAKSATNCQEVLKREKNTLMKCQSWEKQKTLLREDLVTEKHKVARLLQELELAKQLQEQREVRWRQEEKAKEELLLQASSLTKERQQNETSTKSKEDHIKLNAETNLRKYKDDIQKLEKEISQVRLKTDSPKIAALRHGIDGSYASSLKDLKDRKESWIHYVSKMVTNFHDYSETVSVKRERECVMCLSEEMSVVFLPCAHQVVCTTCNELHEKQGMKECPSCRSPIQRRITVSFAR